jgi:hypothetical protein
MMVTTSTSEGQAFFRVLVIDGFESCRHYYFFSNVSNVELSQK